MVIVVKPEYANNAFDINNAPEEAFLSKTEITPCPNLYWEGDESRCRIHHYDWFKQTPCWDFDQIGQQDEECRIGKFIRKNKSPGYWRKYCDSIITNSESSKAEGSQLPPTEVGGL